MRYSLRCLLLGSLILFLVVSYATGRAATREIETDVAWEDGRVEPAAVEEAFLADFESEPAGLSPNAFSLTLGGAVFDFIFTLEGDGYGPYGFRHEAGFGLGGSGSILLQSGASDFDGFERVIIARNDVQDFIFSNLFINNRGGMPVTVAGYDNGLPVGAAQTVGNGAAAMLDFSDLMVDEVWLTSADFYETYIDVFAGNTTAEKDYGDLPASYGLTSDVDDGARHLLGAIYLGSCVDGDPDGQPSTLADGDDGDGSGTTMGVCAVDHADEDGVTPGGNWQNGAGGGSIVATITGGGCLSGWIDWAGDNRFAEAGDQILNMVPVSNGANPLTFDVPDGVFSGGGPQLSFYARFRLVADAGLAGDCSDDAGPAVNGPAMAGEVEDYLWRFSPTAIDLQYVSVSAQHKSTGSVNLLIVVLLAGTTLYASRIRGRRMII